MRIIIFKAIIKKKPNRNNILIILQSNRLSNIINQ